MSLYIGCWQFGRITIATFYQWIHACIAGPVLMRLFRCENEQKLNQQGAPLNPNGLDMLEIGTYVPLSEGEN